VKSFSKATFGNLYVYLSSYWGLTLERAGGPRCSCRTYGAWKTGWVISGYFPGHGHGHRRFNTLKEVAAYSGFHEAGSLHTTCNFTTDSADNRKGSRHG
jgi:hypothetical protein